MIIVSSRNNIPIRLTRERWRHIVTRHPEINDQQTRVLQTISDPALVQQGDFGELIAIRYYRKTPLTSKYLVVVYQEQLHDGFVITAYFTARPSERRAIVWKQ